MRLLIPVATAGLLLVAPLVVFAGSKDAFRFQAQEQHEARHADLLEIQERQERAEKVKQQREVEHPEMLYDEEPDDLTEDDRADGAPNGRRRDTAP